MYENIKSHVKSGHDSSTSTRQTGSRHHSNNVSPRKLEGSRDINVQHLRGKRYPSVMRKSINSDTDTSFIDENTKLPMNVTSLTVSLRDRIIKRRGCFHDLPVVCSSDLVHGSWWFFWGSLLTIFIPVFPLLSIYFNFWEHISVLPELCNVLTYVLLIFSGFLYTIGSAIFIRAVEEPTPTPLFEWEHFATDELFAMWIFFFGTVPYIPCVSFYCYYDFQIPMLVALIVVIIACIATFLCVLSCYPSETKHHAEYISPCVKRFFGKNSPFQKHVQNDWLIACWLIFLGCVCATFVSIAQLAHYSYLFEIRGIFDYSTGFFDCLLFTAGSIYFVSGSYPEEESLHEDMKEIEIPQFDGIYASDNNNSSNEQEQTSQYNSPARSNIHRNYSIESKSPGNSPGLMPGPDPRSGSGQEPRREAKLQPAQNKNLNFKFLIL